MRIVSGIGNPGRRYENTRHNIGFLILDTFAAQNNLSFKPSRFEYYFAENLAEENPFVLVKPSAYVNNSGIAVAQALQHYNIELIDLLIIVDDVNLEIGRLRVRASGGDGGHNGMKSIIYHTASDRFPRIRIGIGSEFTKGEMADYVLSKFHKGEIEIIKQPVELTLNLIKEFISGGTKQMLDFYSKNK